MDQDIRQTDTLWKAFQAPYRTGTVQPYLADSLKAVFDACKHFVIFAVGI